MISEPGDGVIHYSSNTVIDSLVLIHFPECHGQLPQVACATVGRFASHTVPCTTKMSAPGRGARTGRGGGWMHLIEQRRGNACHPRWFELLASHIMTRPSLFLHRVLYTITFSCPLVERAIIGGYAGNNNVPVQLRCLSWVEGRALDVRMPVVVEKRRGKCAV